MDAGSHSVLGNSDLLQVIFAQIPLSELLKSTARVCQLWNRVIHDEQMNYLPFKKSFSISFANSPNFPDAALLTIGVSS